MSSVTIKVTENGTEREGTINLTEQGHQVRVDFDTKNVDPEADEESIFLIALHRVVNQFVNPKEVVEDGDS